MKNFAIGIDDFKTVYEECYYVDKSLLLDDLINCPTGTAFLFTRPHRFGKSINKSMIDYFFNLKYDTEYIFKKLKIAKINKNYKLYLIKYPVINITLKDIIGNNSDEFIKQMKECMSEIYFIHKEDIYSKLNIKDKNFYNLILNETCDIT